MMLADKIGAREAERVRAASSATWPTPTRRCSASCIRSRIPSLWPTREAERLRLVRDVGDDPAAFRARIEAEARAEWEAEAKAAPPTPSPAAGMQPSLGTARSVAGRTAGAWTGEPSLEDVLSVVQNRKRPNGAGGSVRY